MKRFGKFLTGLLLLLALMPAAWAQSVQEAKQQGLVGERRDGFLGLVADDAPPEIQAMVDQVNEERRRRYQEIAQENGITMGEVVALAYERAVAETQPGHYIQMPSGQWVRK